MPGSSPCSAMGSRWSFATLTSWPGAARALSSLTSEVTKIPDAPESTMALGGLDGMALAALARAACSLFAASTLAHTRFAAARILLSSSALIPRSCGQSAAAATALRCKAQARASGRTRRSSLNLTWFGLTMLPRWMSPGAPRLPPSGSVHPGQRVWQRRASDHRMVRWQPWHTVKSCLSMTSVLDLSASSISRTL